MNQNRKSRMEKAEGSRENMRGSGSSGRDLGTSSDRAMWEKESSSPRERGMGETGERGMGWSGERNRSASNSDRRGGITNRDLDTEQREQDQLPERGRSKSDSEC